VWKSPLDLVFLLFWSTLLFGIVGAAIAAAVAVVGWWRKLEPASTVFLTVTILTTILLFVDRFGWCYGCHQFLDDRAPHLVYTPTRSFMMTVALAVGCVAVGAIVGGIVFLIVRFWRARRVRVGLYAVAVGGLTVAVVISILSTPTLGVKTYTTEEAGTPVRQGGVGRVLLIVDDGATWDIIDSLMAERKLPAYRHLVRAGVRGHLATLSPTVSPPIWTTLATGHTALRHGVGGFINYAYPGMKNGISAFPCPTRMMLPEIFIKLNAKGFGSSRPLGPSHRKVRALWTIAGDLGIDVGIVGWRYTWPVENVNGFMVSDRLHYDRPKDHVHPAELARYVTQVVMDAPEVDPRAFTSCMVESLAVDPKASDRLSLLRHFTTTDLKYHVTADSLFTSLKPEFMALGLTSIDAIEHLFYFEHALSHEPARYRMTKHMARFTSPELVRCLGGVIDSTYIFHDRLMQHWIDWLNEDDVLIVVSDHGHVMNGNAHHFPEPGILIMYGKPFRKGLNLSGASVYDIAPTVLYLLGLPVPEDMPGRVLEKAFLGAYLDDNPIRTVKSYETSKLEEIEPPPEVDEELLRKLKALGYIR
jgi:predicted AlkP superfamily phosphohydrolase/phosphomutase